MYIYVCVLYVYIIYIYVYICMRIVCIYNIYIYIYICMQKTLYIEILRKQATCVSMLNHPLKAELKYNCLFRQK